MIRRTEQPTQGFTLIEILVAILLIGILIMVVLVPMTSLFGMNRNTNSQLSSNVSAQRVTEQIKGLWRDQDYYDRNCILGVTTTGMTVTVNSLNTMGVSTGTATTAVSTANCNTSALGSSWTPVPLKRLTVTSGSGTGAAVLTIDLVRPAQ